MDLHFAYDEEESRKVGTQKVLFEYKLNFIFWLHIKK